MHADLAGASDERHGPATLAASCLLAAMAGGMGWGIRGQYGHETGAMIAGLLVGYTLVLIYCRSWTSLQAARAIALVTVGVSFGGSMTYGQTLGLTQNAHLIGNYEALRWGLLGTFVKGGIWIGFVGAFLGMGLGGKRYRPLDMALLMATLIALFIFGVWALNKPFNPAEKIVPPIYFSESWYWKPEGDVRPRPENWGGLLCALAGLIVYLYAARRDWLAGNMALVGCLAGGLGFSLGQCVQAAHAWNRDLLVGTPLEGVNPYVNWWNMMEITFGAIWGFVVAAGLWIQRARIRACPADNDVEIAVPWEFVLAVGYVFALVAGEFLDLFVASMLIEFGIVAGAASLLLISGGRYWPYLFALVIVAVPIAGKTLRELAYEHSEVTLQFGWITLVLLPLGVMLAAALAFAAAGKRGQSARPYASIGLLLATWLYFGLNFGFFRIPWPWEAWTGRTPSAIIFFVCSIGLTLAAIVFGLRKPRPQTETAE